MTAGADCTVIVWYFRKAVELLKEEEEEAKRLSEIHDKINVIIKHGLPVASLEMQQQPFEDYYIDIPIHTDVTNNFDNVLINLNMRTT